MKDEPQTLFRLNGRLIVKLIYYWLGFIFGYQLGEQLAAFVETNLVPMLTSQALEVIIGVSTFVIGFLLVCLSEIIARKKPDLLLLLAGLVFFLGIALGYGGVRLIVF